MLILSVNVCSCNILLYVNLDIKNEVILTCKQRDVKQLLVE